MKLAEIYEILNEPRKALDLVHQGYTNSSCFHVSLIHLSLVVPVIDSRKKRPGPKSGTGAIGSSGDPGQASLFEERPRTKSGAKSAKPQKLSISQLRELEAQKEKEVTLGYHRVKELWSRMLADEEEAVREWLVEAEKLVEAFRETKNLFLTSRVRSFYSRRSCSFFTD